MMRHRSYVAINIIGLSIALVCTMVIGLFVQYELSYDQYHAKKDRVQRVYMKGKLGETSLKGAWTPSVLGPTFYQEFPEVEDFCRIDTWNETTIRYENKGYIEPNFGMADSSFFNIFSIPLLKGDPDKALASKYSVVLSESNANRIFGDEDPIGKSIRIGSDTSYYTVTGVMKDIPGNTHFYYSAIASFMTSPRANQSFWLSNNLSSYLLLSSPDALASLKEKIPGLVNERIGPELQEFMGVTFEEFRESENEYGYYLQDLTAIHLDPSIQHDLKPVNDKKYIYIFSLVAVLILLMASINYTNLATARSSGRALEIGMRKIVGSSRNKLIWQFLTESFILTLFALFVSIILLEIIAPSLNAILGYEISFNIFAGWYYLPALLGITVILGFLSGTYPAFFLSSFKPLGMLSKTSKSSSSGKILRNVLVVTQLTVSVFLIFSSIMIYRQVHFMLNKDLGYNKENLLVIRRAGALKEKQNTFLQEVEKFPGVTNASLSTAVPNYPNNNNGYRMEGQSGDKAYLMQTNWVDYNYLETYQIEMKEGRFFTKGYGMDSTACVINESAVKQFGLEDPLSKRFMRPVSQGEFEYLKVIGVVKDFHYQSLRERIYPSIFILRDPETRWGYISVRLDEKANNNTVRNIENTWNKLTANDPMVYFYMNDDYETIYKEDRRTGNLALAFAILSVIIASLGLYGLTAFTTRQRTKEIGIRKANGASTRSVMLLLYKNTALLVLIASILAWSAGYFFSKNWLGNFYFRTHLSAWEFILSLGIVAFVAWITISYKSYRAASINPSDALRYE